jgi:uncharacterized protein (TIGR02421 family)
MSDNIAIDKELFEIDHVIDDLVKKIELLDYINPINIEEEKDQFFKYKYAKNPRFMYPAIDFNGFQLHRVFFKQKIEAIQNVVIRRLYEDIVYSYMNLIECIDNIGNAKRFYYNCLSTFGTPKEKDVENAKFILHFEDEEETPDLKPEFDPDQAEAYFKEFSKQYSFKFNIEHSSKITAIAMVLNNSKTLVINKHHLFSKNELKVLANHEIGVHLVTTMNGIEHPLKIFSHGFPNNVETQEGLAVFSEYMSNSLTLKRLKELAYRVIAVDSLAKGYDFKRTFNLLKNKYKLDRESSFYITLRAHRGGGFTKDYLYLTGLKKVYDYHQKGYDLSLLMTGKVSLEYADTINYLIQNGYALKPKFHNKAFEINENQNKLVTFILNNLK